MADNIIIYKDGMTTKVWMEAAKGQDFCETLVSFYAFCGGKVTPEIFGKSIHYMSPVDACNLFNQLVNDVVLSRCYMNCTGTELYEVDNG